MENFSDFFAVTLTSVYSITVCNNEPLLEKIALRGKSEIEIGEKHNAPMLSIGKQLILFIPEGGGLGSFERRIEFVNTRYWGANTSLIVALFTKRKDAMKCFLSGSNRLWDSHWLQNTREVLQKIENDHPQFSVTHEMSSWIISSLIV